MEKQLTVYIEKDWVNGEFDFLYAKNTLETLAAKGLIAKKREEFIENLLKEGFNVTFNKSDIKEDTICLIMDNTALCDNEVSIDEYKKLFDEKIFASGGPNFYYPFSLRVEDFFKSPFFPAVFKNEFANGGVDKFLIENRNQLEIMKSFYEQYSHDEPYKLNFANSIFQQYLENPGEYSTYIRVLVGGTGAVLGASLKYSTRTMVAKENKGIFEQVFLDSKSKYFIDAKRMFNYYSGGGNIYFNQPRYSNEKRDILKEHGFDLNDLHLPNEILDVCENIMLKCNREIGVLCGIDFMLNEADGKWYYLENQAFPAIDEWAQAKNISLPKGHDIKDYMKLLELELKTRYEALMMLVNKKRNEDSFKLEKKM